MSCNRIAVLAACLSLAVLGWAGSAYSQTYPGRPVRIIVPYGAGVTPDVIARLVGEELSRRFGQQFVVENRAGAGGKIGTEAAAQAAPDGYTLLLGSKDTHGVLVHLYPGWSVDPVRDFVPVSLLIRIQNVIVANPGVPASTPRELIQLASSGDALAYGTPGVGTNLHLMAELLQQQYGLKLIHVPYKNFGEAFPAAIRGDLKLVVTGVPPAVPMVKDGRLKAIAVTGASRSPYLPNVPTFAEAGIPGFETGGWFGLLAPAGTPQEIVSRLAGEIAAIGAQPAFRERVEKMSSEVSTSTPAQFAALIRDETARWGEVVRKAGIKVE